MSTNDFLEDALTSHQTFLLRYGKRVSRDVMDEINKALALIEDAILTGGDTVLRTANLVQIRNLVSGLDTWENVNGIIIEGSTDLAIHEVAYMEDLFVTATTATTNTIVRTSPAVLFESIAGKKMLLRGASGRNQFLTIAEATNTFTSKVPRDVISTIQKGVSDGDSVGTISRNVNRMVNTRTRNESEALTRTITNFVGTESRMVASKTNSDLLQGERYTATLDSRTTFICMSNDGKIFPVGLGLMPPAHWNCRSVRVAVVKPQYQLPGLVGERPEITINKDGSSKRGTVSAKVTYSGWLKRQPAAFQDDVLGPERGKLFRSGKVKLDKFVDTSGRTFTLRELADSDKAVADSLAAHYGGNIKPSTER